MNEAIIGIGSNINPNVNIKKARNIISEKLNIIKSSTFVETEPIGNKNQNNFINGALLVNTKLSLEELQILLKNIEKIMGRVKKQDKYAPRIIDLDILAWNGKIIDNDIHFRKFLKDSILELIPEFKELQ